MLRIVYKHIKQSRDVLKPCKICLLVSIVCLHTFTLCTAVVLALLCVFINSLVYSLLATHCGYGNSKTLKFV